MAWLEWPSRIPKPATTIPMHINRDQPKSGSGTELLLPEPPAILL